MIKISTMPKETLVELLLYLAENEKFPSVSKELKGGVTVDEVKDVLRELAMGLAREEQVEKGEGTIDMLKQAGASAKARKIMSALSAREEKTILNAFGFNNG